MSIDTPSFDRIILSTFPCSLHNLFLHSFCKYLSSYQASILVITKIVKRLLDRIFLTASFKPWIGVTIQNYLIYCAIQYFSNGIRTLKLWNTECSITSLRIPQNLISSSDRVIKIGKMIRIPCVFAPRGGVQRVFDDIFVFSHTRIV